MALKLSLLLQAVDRISAPVKRIQQSTQRMGEGIQRAGQKIERAGAPMQRLSGKVQQLRTRLLGALVAVNRAAGPNGLDLLGKASDKAGYAVGRLMRKMAGVTVGAVKFGAAAGVAAAGYAAFDLFRTAAQFEDYAIMLENMEGSSAKAKASMDWVRKFAEDTPYSLEEVMEAFVQLKGYGIDPMAGALVAMGDTAAGMNKPLMDAVEALADAEISQFERLRSFAIRTRVEGDKVTFSYQKNGKTIERTAKNEASAIRAALFEVMGGKFVGMMDKKSKRFNGLIANIGDKWTQFLNMTADAGIFDKVKGKLEGLLAKLNEMARDGRLEVWAGKISNRMEQLVDWTNQFTEEDFDGVINDLGRAANAATELASAILSIVEAAGKVKRVGANITYGMDWLILGSKEADKNWERMYPDEKRQKSSRELRREARDAVGLNGPKKGLKLPGGALPRAKVPGAASDSGKVKVGGVIELKVSAAQGTKVAVTNMKPDSRDVPLSIMIARSMGLPA